MIVNAKNQTWEIIFQRNHALLAAQIASHIKEEFRPPHWIETLSAIAEHDDSQTDWGADSRITENGKPLDFTALGCDINQAEQVVKNAHYKSQWVKLLVSMHTTSLYEDIENKSDELNAFLQRQKGIQQSLIHRFNISDEESTYYYNFLRWCDECSLILCQDRLSNSPLTIGRLRDQKENTIELTSNYNEVIVKPWCFDQKEFTVSSEVYSTTQLTFDSDQELKTALQNSTPEIRSWKFKKS